MATVPTYDQFQVSQSVKPLTPVSSPDFQNHAAERIQKQGQAMQQAGSAIGKIETDMQNTANNTRIKDADRQLVELDQQLEYGKAGYTNLRGKNALERPDKKSLVDEYGKQFDDAATKISKELGNDAQRQAFAEVTARRRASLSDRIMRHVNKESRDYTIGVQEGTIKVARDQMALSWGDSNVTAGAASQARDARRELGKLSGQSDKQIQAGIIDELSPAHAAVISSAIDAGKIDYAKQYLKANNAELTPDARVRIRNAIEIHDDLKQAQESVDTIYAMDGTPQQRMAAARDITDAKTRKATVAGLHARFREDDWLKQRGHEQGRDDALGYLAKGEAIPVSVLSTLDNSTKIKIQKIMLEGSRPKYNDPISYYELKNMNADQFAKADLGSYIDKLTPSTWESMATDQAKARGGDFSYSTDTAKLNDAIKSLGISKKDKGAFIERADNWARSLGHKPSDDELKTWIVNMKEDVLTDKGVVYDSHERVGNIHIEGVPDLEISSLVKGLQSVGKAASDKNILELYQAGKK